MRGYFADRPPDLPALDITAGRGWEELCGFLGVTMPEVPFPHDNRFYEWGGRKQQLVGDINDLYPVDESLIPVDEQQLGADFPPGRRVIPFIEREGEYWGLPIDDAHAVEELERLRRAGAAFIAFISPTFWWLDYYQELQDHLSRYECVARNERLIAFDLRRPHPPS